MHKVRRWSQSTLLVVVASALTVTVVEMGLNVFDVFPEKWPKEFEKYQQARREAHNYAGEHAYYQPHSVVPIYAEGSMAFGEIDDFGYLGRGEPQAKQSDLLVFGDSFAYGYGVEGHQAFAALLHGYNAGVWGEAFPMHAKVFRRVTPLVKPTRAIWVLYPPHIISCTTGGWTTRRNFSREKYPVGAWLIGQFNKTKLSTLVLGATGWGLNRTDYYSLEWSLYDASDRRNDEGYLLFDQAVKEVVAIAKEQHVHLIALLVPSKNQVALELEAKRPLLYPHGRLQASLASDHMAEILSAHGIKAESQIDLMDMMRREPTGWKRYYFKTDAHLNTTGNSAVAKFIAERLQHISTVGHDRTDVSRPLATRD